MLASDREREATVLRLRAAHLEGRIGTEEFEDRVGRLGDRRTLVLVHGVAPLGVQRAFARLGD